MALLNRQPLNPPRFRRPLTRQNRCDCSARRTDHTLHCRLSWILEYAQIELRSAQFHREGFLLSRLQWHVIEARNNLRNEECPICLEPFGHRCKFNLPCDPSHIFHKRCLNLWSRKSTKCPLCRKKYLVRVQKQIKVRFEQLRIDQFA